MRPGTLSVTLLAGAVLCTFFSCEKVTLDSRYIIRPYVEDTANVERRSPAEAFGYILYGDTADWQVRSWDDAVAGRFHSRQDGRTVTADLAASLSSDSILLFPSVTAKSFIAVVCELEHGMYGWKQLALLENIEQIDIPVLFRPWNRQEEYVWSGWNIVNENIPDEPENEENENEDEEDEEDEDEEDEED